ncbi:hypothetical protein GCM10029964_092830 [Kibdelosporangium lantanae]
MSHLTLVTDQPATDPRRGLIVGVLRSADGVDCTLDGFSSRYAKLTVVGVISRVSPPPGIGLRGDGDEWVCMPLPRGSRVFAPDAHRPAVALYCRDLGDGRPVWSIVAAPPVGATSVEIRQHVTRGMMGGNFAHTSDSRFRQLIDMYGAVAIHDRIEHGR